MTITLPASIANLVQPTRYIPVTETAKMIRRALKEAFPEIRFSVKTHKYAGGSSINVQWTDGPLAKQVEPIAKTFQGGYFDGMTDYKGSYVHTIDGAPVSFGGSFVFCCRAISDSARANLEAALEAMSPEDRQQLAYQFDGVWQHYEAKHDTVATLARMIFNNRPMPAFDGRSSKLAASVSYLSSH